MALDLPMSEDRPRYYFVKRGQRAYWQPGKFGAGYGFEKSVPLGVDGPEAKKTAIDWNAKLDAVRAARKRGDEEPKPYPNGSLGAFYQKFKTTESWAQLSPASREHYERAWPHIEKRFGRTRIDQINAHDSERFHVDLHPQHANAKRDPKGAMKLTWHQAHLVLKHWRLLLNALVAYHFIAAPAPIGRVSNPQPPPRAAVWVDEEIQELIAKATAMNEYAMAVAIRVGWDTMMSTVDCRLLPIGPLHDESGDFIGGWISGRWADDTEENYIAGVIATRRAKSGAIVRVATTPEVDTAIAEYLRDHHPRPSEPDEALLVRGAAGAPFKDRHAFKATFAAVREAAFPGDKRVFGDMRRSGATEAKLGGVNNEDLAPSMANQLDKNQRLQSTYIVAASENVLKARQAGRSKHSAKFRNSQK